MYAEEENISAYCGENTIYGGKCMKGMWALFAEGSKRNSFPTIKFYNVACEGVTNAIHIENAEACVFEWLRIAEMKDLGGIVMELIGDCRYSTLKAATPIRSSSLAFEGLHLVPKVSDYPKHYVRVDAPIETDGGSIIGKMAYIGNEGLIIVPFCREEIRMTMGTKTIGYNEPQFSYVKADGNCTINLNASYSPYGVDELMIEQNNGAICTINDMNGNEIVSDDSPFICIKCVRVSDSVVKWVKAI